MLLFILLFFIVNICPENVSGKLIDREQVRTISENEAMSFWLNAPSVVETGEPFSLTIEAWDSYERISSNYKKEISFFSTDPTAVVPDNYKFTSNAVIEQGILPGYLKKGADNGKHVFNNLTFNTPGFQYIGVIDIESNEKFLSNPIKVVDDSDIDESSYHIYWGDIHGHSDICDGAGTLNQFYSYARDVALLDFAAVTTHDHYIEPGTMHRIRHHTHPLLVKNFFWDRIKKSARTWNDEGKFVTLLAFEWTSNPQTKGYGHYNIYYSTDDGPFFSSTFPETENITDVWKTLRKWKSVTGRDVITIPHHPTRDLTPVDWSFYDEEFVPLVEIYSIWGSGEMLGSEGNPKPIKHGRSEIEGRGYSIQDALSMGRKVGSIASGDSHDGHPGHSLMHTPAHNPWQYPLGGLVWHGHQSTDYKTPFPSGTVAIFSEELSRDSIFSALKSRRCYATTHGDRMIIEFRVNGKEVGGDTTVLVNEGKPRIIEGVVAGDGNLDNSKIAKIELVKNNRLVYFKEGKSLVEEFSYTDYEPITGMEYDAGFYREGKFWTNDQAFNPMDERPGTGGEGFYYLRVTEENGEMGWIGPIWVKEGKKEQAEGAAPNLILLFGVVIGILLAIAIIAVILLRGRKRRF